MKFSVLIFSFFCFSAYSLAGDDELVIQDVAQKNIYDNWQGVVGSASVESGLFFDASFLYLKPEVGGLAFADTINVSEITAPDDVAQVKFRPKNLNFEWDPGLSVGLGYIFSSKEQSQISAYWTYLHSNADEQVTVSGRIDNNFISPIWFPFILGANADRAKANWTLNFNVADVAASRNLFLGEWLAFKPKLGLRAAWIHQDYEARYRGGYTFNDAGVSTTLFKNTSFTASNDYKGVGVHFGTDLEWFITKSFSFIGGGFLSLLYGDFEIREKFDGGLLVSFGGDPQILNEEINVREDFTAVRPSLEAKIGLKWQKLFNENHHRFMIGVFYQVETWFDQNELIAISNARDSTPLTATAITANNYVMNETPGGNLEIQGLRVELRLDF
ncbi:MAG: Lpg1974 family pore-forming outer membrane protein [Candidatus Algichlamydia australiensis]|nr:Lpg1974 family pore-forming outer membrane protein [Chlamydiales bacterium]